MTKLHRLYDEQGQSPWLDNLTRAYLREGTLNRFISQGIRGITTNPTIMAKSIEGSDAYSEQIAALAAEATPSDAYWALVSADVRDALSALRPVFDASGGNDGFVSIEVAPDLATTRPVPLLRRSAFVQASTSPICSSRSPRRPPVFQRFANSPSKASASTSP